MMELGYKEFKAYIAQFPGDYCHYFEPSCRVEICSKETGKRFIEPFGGETAEIFLDRLERSKKAGRNLFYEEWESWEPLDGVDY